MVSPNEILLILIIVGMTVAILSSRLPSEIVALGVLLVLAFTNLVDTNQAVSGFSSSVVITLIGLFVITHALEITGVVQWLADRVDKAGRGSTARLIALFMLAGAALSLVMNNVAAGALLLPAAVRVAQFSNVRPSQLLIPVSFGTLVGGMATYLTTANIVMSGLLIERGFEGLNFIDFLPTGGMIIIVSVIYMVTVGRRLLPEHESLIQTLRPDLQKTYQLEERLWEVRVLPNSWLSGVKLGRTGIGEQLGLTVLAIWHGQQAIFTPAPDTVLHTGDFLLVLGRRDRLDLLLGWGTELRDDHQSHRQMHERAVDLVEVIVAPRAGIIGQTLTEIKFRQNYGVTAVAMWREGRSYRTDVGKMPLQIGDALLVVGEAENVSRLAKDRNFILPLSGGVPTPRRIEKRPLALVITLVALVIAILDLVPLPEVMLAGAVALVLTRCITMPQFYESIEWRVIFLIAGIFPLSIAISETGLADRIGGLLVEALAGNNPLVLIGGVFVLVMLVTQIIGGQVAALLVGPIAINAAVQVGVNPQAMAVAVAIACSTAFLTPIAHPVNVLMMGAGGYSFGDFFRVGIGMTVITLVMLLVGLVVFWGVG